MPSHSQTPPFQVFASEIIDVDALDEDDVLRPSRRPRGSEPAEIIELLDSDDERPQINIVSGSVVSVTARGFHTVVAESSRSGARFVVISLFRPRPNHQQGQPRASSVRGTRRRQREASPPTAQYPARRADSIAPWNIMEPPDYHRQADGTAPGILQRLAGFNPLRWAVDFGFGPPPAAAQPLPTFARAHDDTLLLERLLPRGLWPDHGIQRLPIVPRAEEVKYKTEWTHPARLEDGFVGDFAPVETIDIVDEGEANETSTALACARCSDPLLLGSNDNSLTPDEVRRRRVWGLRCGHVIDGKCLEELYKPLEEEEAPVPPSKRKGKGKARARDRMEEVDPTDVEDDASGLLPAPISTRLRSRAMLGVAERSTHTISRVPAFRPKPKTKSKGRRARKPVVEAQHDWACPVLGCARGHRSDKINGEWVNPPEMGAIAMFV
ncbi:unnamed protein product [Mycena citricolor]|uniref:Uncharacterized protein n=1 Tax=Mycena citricolor TaxID=2018698 RepID=A0AAD2H665_9AGAR|nr:unnamed protein product [Mycena citricolor]